MEQLYSLRKNFTIIGITGKTGSGCSEIAEMLSQENFNLKLDHLIKEETTDTDQLKLNIAVNYLKGEGNWKEFKIISYKNVLLLHLFYEAIAQSDSKEEAIKNIWDFICQDGNENNTNKRFNKKDEKLFTLIKSYLTDTNLDWYNYAKSNLICDTLKDCLSDKKEDKDFNNYYFNVFEKISTELYKNLNEFSITKRILLTHDLANNLRAFGTVRTDDFENADLKYIYSIAETINRLIKNWKSHQGKDYCKIVIDSLKNSLELMFFKEKYSAFYTIATNKSDLERKNYLKTSIEKKYKSFYKSKEIEFHVESIISLSEQEYKGGDVNKGNFSSPDVENCIQKSDYHIFYSNIYQNLIDDFKLIDNRSGLEKASLLKLEQELSLYPTLDLRPQIVKLISLIHQPGLFTPTAYERLMQIAYNAKANSGCISRQVGAVVTDDKFSVKAVGWNDIPRNQIPCSLRKATDLINNKNTRHFSEFERGENGTYKDKESFKTKISNDYKSLKPQNLNGKPCSFCFKTHHNAYEGEKNQVHTRSLHAEENAMLQISKYGGQGLKNGNLFTTASPCELCSKKAFQLGIKRIFYIDPYPGIATKHVLKNSKIIEDRPELVMFQGAVGRAFHKLFEPFMSYKDELAILTRIKPTLNKIKMVNDLTDDVDSQKKIMAILGY